MKRLLPFALLTFSLLGVALFTMSHSSSAYAKSSTELAPVYEHNLHHKFIGDQHNKEGGYIVFANPVYDATDQKVIGSSNGVCTYTSNTLYQCDWTLTLPNGNIVLSGTQNEQQSKIAYAVVGGTGAYYQIKGEANLTLVGNEYKYTFHLSQA
jgi:hypothetical protein